MRLTLLSLGSRAAMTAAHLGATYIVLERLTAEQQGYYYAFVALIAIQTLFELGLSQVLVVFLAYECQLDLASTDTSRPNPSGRACVIVAASLRQYGRLTALYCISVGTAGCLFFALFRARPDAVGVDWAAPWIALVALSSLRLPLAWLEAVLEGMGELPYVLATRIAAHAVWLLALLWAVVAGAALYSLPIATLALVSVSAAAYWPNRRLVAQWLQPGSHTLRAMDWKQESGAMQRRVSGTWIASYLISYTPVPLVMALLGPVAAGQAGVAFQFSAAIGVIAGALIAPRLQHASRLVASGAQGDYSRLLSATLRKAAVSAVATGAVALLVLIALPRLKPQFGARLPSLLVVSLLLGAAVANCLLSCVAVFSRARKQERFTIPLFAVASLTTVGTVAAQGFGGLVTIAALHLGAALLVTLPAVLAALKQLQMPIPA